MSDYYEQKLGASEDYIRELQDTIAELEQDKRRLADSFPLREIVAQFVMDIYKSHTGHFWFDEHNAEELLEAIDKAMEESDERD